MGDNIDAKFGPPPAIVCRPHEMLGMLTLQFVTCIVILVMIQPQFVLTTEYEMGGEVDYTRVLVLSLLTTLYTLVMYSAGVSPKDTIVKSCEIIHRMSRT